jgi:hypothetical protein
VVTFGDDSHSIFVFERFECEECAESVVERSVARCVEKRSLERDELVGRDSDHGQRYDGFDRKKK